MKLQIWFFVLILISFLCGCNTNKITVYVQRAQANDAYIWGGNLRDFYLGNTDAMKIEKHKIKIDRKIRRELIYNREILQKKKTIDKLMGHYKYAIHYKKDTFYISSNLISWMYNQRVGIIESDLIKDLLETFPSKDFE